jgi:hypothetical protein
MALFIHGEHLTEITYATNSGVFINEFLTFLLRKEYRISQINIPDYGSIEPSEKLVHFSQNPWHPTKNDVPPYVPKYCS